MFRALRDGFRPRTIAVHLFVVCLAYGSAAGLLFGSLLGLFFSFATTPRAQRWALASLYAVLLAPISYWLFTGGRMSRLPALWLLRPVSWLLLTAVITAVSVLSLRVLSFLDRQRWSLRVVSALLFAVLAFVFHALDHRLFPRLYEYLHSVLGVLTALSYAAGLWLLRPKNKPVVVPWIGALIASLIALLFVSEKLESWKIPGQNCLAFTLRTLVILRCCFRQ